MLSRTSTLLATLLLLGALAACNGNGDDDATPPAAEVTPTVAQAQPTTTPGVIRTPSSGATETPIVIQPATIEPSPPPATPTIGATENATPEAYTSVQAALAEVLLQRGELPGAWTRLRQVAVADAPKPGLCGAEPFSDADSKVAEVETEYQSEDNSTFVVQNLAEYPESVAEQAIEYIRESVDCEHFTDSSGLTVELSEAEAPEVGDDAFAVQASFQAADAGRLQGEFIYIRVGGLLASLSYLTAGEYDRAAILEIAEIVADKMEATGGTVRFSLVEQALISGLLEPEDLDRGWRVLDSAGVSDAEGWRPLCGADPFGNFDELSARVSVLLGEDQGDDDAATIQQVISAYPSSVADDALEYERQSATCEQWTTGETTITLSASQLSGLDDDLFAAHFAFMQDGNKVEGEWIAVRVNDLVANIIYTDPASFDAEQAQEIVEAAIEEMELVALP
ncbi:MAG: hypothetical protein M3N47_12270 [Chloroflexota bacterium]|nr:hypothetical protein [Chloroflexota bacterium]